MNIEIYNEKDDEYFVSYDNFENIKNEEILKLNENIIYKLIVNIEIIGLFSHHFKYDNDEGITLYDLINHTYELTKKLIDKKYKTYNIKQLLLTEYILIGFIEDVPIYKTIFEILPLNDGEEEKFMISSNCDNFVSKMLKMNEELIKKNFENEKK